MALVPVDVTGDQDGIECIGHVVAAPGSRLQFSWGTGTSVRLCEVFSPSTGAGGDEPHAAFCEWSPPVGEQRRIAYDIIPIYKKLRETLHVLGPGRQMECKEALREYSRGVLEILTTSASDPAAGPPQSEEALHVAYEAGLWQLLELFFLSSDTPEGFFAEAFAAWLGQHGGLLCSPPGFHALAAEAHRLFTIQRVDSEPGYWPCLQRLVLTGQLEAALRLLTAHPAYQALQDPDMAAKVEALEVVYNLLRVVPRFSRAGGSSGGMLASAGTASDDVVAFSAERAVWRRRVDELWESREQLLADLKKLDPAAAKGLAGLLCILCAGSDSSSHALASFRFMASVATNWVELLAGTLLWKYPTLQPQLHLRHLIPKIKDSQGLVTRQSDEAFLEFFEQLLLAACDQEVQSVISLCTNMPYCTLQFVAHIYDVLRALPGAERIICRPLPHFGGDQAEMFTLHYVETLVGHAATWQLAAEYLAWCPVHGAAVMEAVLEKSPFPLQDESTALKAIALANRHGLTAAAASLARRLGMAAAQGGRLAAALQWMMRAHDPARCAELVAPLLAKVQQQLLEQVGSYQAAPLDVPELWDLEPLLMLLPAQHSHTSSSSRGFPPGQQGSSSRGLKALGQVMESRPYQERHFLQVFLRLQVALAEVHHCQQQQQQQPQRQQQALTAAYAAVREPALELLLEGLAPAAMQLPLLLYLVPVFETVYMPFSRSDVHRLLQVLNSAGGDLPAAAAAAVLAGTHSSSVGLGWPAVAGAAVQAGSNKLHVRHVNDVRLALCRGLAKAHVTESSLQGVVSS